MYIPGRVQGREVNFLIDTGATVTIMNSPIYEQMYDLQKPYLESASQQMKMADGKCIQTRGVGIMDITINDTVVKHAVWVAEIDKAIDGILGFDFLQSNQCVIDAGTNTTSEMCHCGIEEHQVLPRGNGRDRYHASGS
ncbi:hypothetical protein ACJMK2_013666 [Sinanodonta woodiana]|uniref:Peptidase A2 domain-containing protein n=1 Tax=Sinanodonta woodiana TaxID=1069815 RepID=A0ABD3V1H1_SINWO